MSKLTRLVACCGLCGNIRERTLFGVNCVFYGMMHNFQVCEKFNRDYKETNNLEDIIKSYVE